MKDINCGKEDSDYFVVYDRFRIQETDQGKCYSKLKHFSDHGRAREHAFRKQPATLGLQKPLSEEYAQYLKDSEHPYLVIARYLESFYYMDEFAHSEVRFRVVRSSETELEEMIERMAQIKGYSGMILGLELKVW